MSRRNGAWGKRKFNSFEDGIEYLTSLFIEGLMLIENNHTQEKKEKQTLTRLSQLILELGNNAIDIRSILYRQRNLLSSNKKFLALDEDNSS